MNKLDQLIREALEGEEREIFEETREYGWFALGLNQFRGKLGWVTWVIMVTQTALFIVGIWCAVHFYQATEVLGAVKWGISMAVAWIVGASLKFSLMPQMQADRILRELKRLELILAARRGE